MTSTTPPQNSASEAAQQPEVVSLLAAGRLLGIGRTKAYRLAKAGAFPCRVLRIGGRYTVPVRGLRALLDQPEPLDNTVPDGASRPAGQEE
ncbi:helix-turn-helix domain-containing protein [Nonomuraea sp. NN258]|uniref:helix-turn-helix domain-containing protein n=1 Tax=Nonomuraea antri TaxID=2730852 RepID=UPI0015688D1F|nr:helix-turn-helix domain-containing protein [Nonomuraea antri]NRQ38446.1 helix-turn-helix domain-containing protein [Nonomuraea antri]